MLKFVLNVGPEFEGMIPGVSGEFVVCGIIMFIVVALAAIVLIETSSPNIGYKTETITAEDDYYMQQRTATKSSIIKQTIKIIPSKTTNKSKTYREFYVDDERGEARRRRQEVASRKTVISAPVTQFNATHTKEAKPMICSHCGGTVNRKTMQCDYCDVRYR